MTSTTTRAQSSTAPGFDSMSLLDLVRELEQQLRMASIRIAIEGQDRTTQVFETLADLAATLDQRLR
jgi:acyl carrier protein